jgi:hypothetical protein
MTRTTIGVCRVRISKRFILWLYKRRHRVVPYHLPVVEWEDGKFGFRRWPLLDHDQYRGHTGKLHSPFPWYRPFNILLHWWRPADEYYEEKYWHDHPRWSITIVLRGCIFEHTPKGCKILGAGSVVLRSHHYIHRFSMLKEHRGKTWTLFIVGPRVHPQNVFAIQRVETPGGKRIPPSKLKEQLK